MGILGVSTYRKIVRLWQGGCNKTFISQRCGVSRHTVITTLKRVGLGLSLVPKGNRGKAYKNRQLGVNHLGVLLLLFKLFTKLYVREAHALLQQAFPMQRISIMAVRLGTVSST